MHLQHLIIVKGISNYEVSRRVSVNKKSSSKRCFNSASTEGLFYAQRGKLFCHIFVLSVGPAWTVNWSILVYNLRHENDLTPSRITTQFYFSITLYIFFSKLSNLRSCSQNNIIIYHQNHITMYGFTNYLKNKVRKFLALHD